MTKNPEDKRKYYPLTHPQKRIYYDELKFPGTGWANNTFIIKYKEELYFDLLAKAINKIIRRNEGLRLRIVEPDPGIDPYQYIYPYKEISIDYIDFSGPDSERRLKEWLEKTSGEAFSLIDSDLFYFARIKFNEHDSGYYFKFHHTISDGWTCFLTMIEIDEIYEALKAGRSTDDTPNPSYLQFIEDEKEYLNSQQIKKDREFWLNNLLPLPEPIDLSRKIGEPKNIKADELVIPFTHNLRTMMHKYRETHKTSIYKLIFSAFSIYLSGVKGTDDIVIGGVNHSRTRDIYREVTGMFVSTFPIRIKVDGNMTFESFVEKTGKDINYILKNHQKYPFDLLGTELRKITGTDPGFLINMVIVGHTKVKKKAYSYKYCFSRFLPNALAIHINLSNKDMDGILELEWHYQVEKFSGSDIRQIHQGLENVLANALINPMQKISEIELLSSEEKRKILDEFNDTEAEYPKDKTIHELFAARVNQTPDHIALTGITHLELEIQNSKQHLTYRKLSQKSHGLAYYLKNKGVQPDTIVGIMMVRSVEMIIGILGVLKSGGAYLPIDPEYPQERIDFMLKDSGAEILLKDNDFTRQAFSNRPKGTSSHPRLSPVPVTSLAYVIYTSGSTGRPKGVMVEHRSLANLCFWHNNFYSVTSHDRASKYAGFGFDASVWEVFPYFIIGASIYIVPEEIKLDMVKLNRYFEENDITVSFLPTQIGEQFMTIDNTSLRVLLAGGDKLKSFIKRNYRLYNNYGPTENTVVTTSCLVTELTTNIPIGKPVYNNQVYILDKNDNFQPVKVPGELCIGGKSLGRGYLNRPELTAEKFIRAVISHSSLVIGAAKSSPKTNDRSQKFPPNDQCPMTNDRLYKTGDLACWLPDGNMVFLGRIDHQVKIRGFRIELGEIESQLVKIPGIKEAVVIARKDQFNENEKYLCAYIVSDTQIDTSVLSGTLLKILPAYMIPSYFIQLEKIPLTHSGKVNRKVLPSPQVEEKGKNYAAPRNEIEEKLVDIWSDILNIEKNVIGIDDNFFKVGGHSLKAAVMTAMIHKALNTTVLMHRVFEMSTIRKLAEYIIKEAKEHVYLSIPLAEKKEYYPQTSPQKRLYILYLMEGPGITYNMPILFLLEGEPDRLRLENAFKKLIGRQESFRTSFEMIENESVQKIHETVDFEIESYDLKSLSHGDIKGSHRPVHDGKIIQHVMDGFVRPFDLSLPPLLRVGLLRASKGKFLLMVDMHHIISDGLSFEIFKKELAGLYELNELPPLTIQYKDYSEWQNKQNLKERLKHQEDYWLKIFAGDKPVLNLPLDYARPAVQVFEGYIVFFEPGKEEAKALKESAKKENTTLFMMLLVVFDIMLGKLSGQEDIVVGTPVAGRRRPELGNTMGMFVNTLALRNYPHGEKTFIKFLNDVKKTALDAFENQDYPFEKLIDRLNVERDVSRNPLFDVMFAWQDIEAQEVAEKGLMMKPYKYRSTVSRFDMTLVAKETLGGFSFELEYCTKLFNEETIKRFIGYFKHIVSTVIKSPGNKISEIDIISEVERNQILYEFNNTAGEYPKDKTIHELFAARVKQTPDAVALHGCTDARMDEPDHITYGELNEKVNQLAFKLKEKGVKPDNIVAIMAGRSIAMVVGILGILKSGGAYLPIELDYPEERLNYMLKDSRVKILLTSPDTRVKVKAKERFTEIIEISSLLSSSTTTLTSTCQVSPTNLAYIIYTSGSSGKPKGVLVQHSSLINLVYAFSRFVGGFGPTDRCLCITNFTFDVSVGEIFIPLLFGSGLSILPREKVYDVHQLCGELLKKCITFAYIHPHLLKEVSRRLVESGVRVALNKMLIGVEPIKDHVLESFFNINESLRVINGYGPTEAAICATFYRYLSCEPVGRNVPIGSPLDNTWIFLLDKAHHLVPINVPGELAIGGAGLSRGYLNNPELTAEKFVEQVERVAGAFVHDRCICTGINKKFLWEPGAVFFNRAPGGRKLYKTGDLARWLWDGNIEFLGRIDFQVKIRGFRIEPGEIERRLMEHPLIKEAVVIDREKQDGNKYLCAYYVSKKEFNVMELRDYLSMQLPEYMIPSYFIRIECMPLTANGKINKKALPTPDRSRLKLQGTYTPPGSEIEKIITHFWKEVLHIDRVGIHDGFFQLGGTSIDMIRLNGKLSKKLKRSIPVVAMFRHPTPASLARYLSEEEEGENSLKTGTRWTRGYRDKGEKGDPGLEIAVVGMAGKFPGAKNIDEFWENLKNGVETISFFSDEELKAFGIEEEWLQNPGYMKAKGFLEDIEYFDSSFFEYSPRDAEIMDPQVRLFHECAWEALENAGYFPDFYEGRVGLYAGASSNLQWEMLSLLPQAVNIDPATQYTVSQLADKDFLCLRVSYKLNLNGPAVVVQTACSTSLVAIDVACQGLLSGKCDMALAGGVSITLPVKSGYVYSEGMIMSTDGHCRAFDANASGTVGGNGMGIVVLKRLKDAAGDGDTIYAVIKGSAINNDGDRKAGFTAPGIEGQARVIQKALQVGGIEPESISYIETHGTGTPMGDSIEIEGLKLAFNTSKKGFCAVGSVKTNIGHLDAAAGAAGFIKTVLVLKHRFIPPSLHFKTPNPKIDLENSPFYVNTELVEWKNDKHPLRAGVSSFGIGGTNAHVVLEEWPIAQSAKRMAQSKEEDTWSQGRGRVSPPAQSREHQLILLSAKTPAALEKMTENLKEYFKTSLLNPGNPVNPTNPGQKNLLNHGNHKNSTHPGPTLADAAYTLQVGRKAFNHRQMLVCSDVNDAIAGLSSVNPVKLEAFVVKEEKRPVVFMFPGQGSQYVNMGVDVYKTEPQFREEMDHCFEILKPLMGYDIKEILYPYSDCRGGSPCPPKDCIGSLGQGDHRGSPLQSDHINQTEIAQPLLFVFEYALAKLLMNWGIRPYAMIGHSIGEYVAACISGVFSLEDALKLVVLRGKLIQSIPTGTMLSISISEKALEPLLKKHKELSLAAVNSTFLCVVSGSTASIEFFEKELQEQGYRYQRLQTSHAFHSKMMAPILETFAAGVKQIKLNPPEIPFISNVTGGWLAPGDAVTRGYWSHHLRRTVRFAEGIENLSKEENLIFVEVGSGQVLSTFVRKRAGKKAGQAVINLFRHPREKAIDGDDGYLISKIGQLWLQGVEIDWRKWTGKGRRRRIPLPTYPFEPQPYPVSNKGNPFKKVAEALLKEREPNKKSNMADWFYVPLWEQTLLPCPEPVKTSRPINWLIFTDEKGLGVQLAKRLKLKNHVTIVKAGTQFTGISDSEFTLHPSCADDYTTLFKELRKLEKIPHKILHLWSIPGDNGKGPLLEEIDRDMDLGFYSLLHIVQAMGRESIVKEIEIDVVTAGMQQVTGEEELRPQHAAILGAVKIIPLEYTNMKCRSIDIVLPAPGSQQENKLITLLEAEFQVPPCHPVEVAAYRGLHRWVRVMKPHPLHQPGENEDLKPLRQEGVYLVTGGLGGMGLTLAEYLAARVKAKLILIGRSPFPKIDEWDQWLAAHGIDDSVSRKIIKIRHMQSCGARVMIIRADVADYRQMQEVIARVHEQFGSVNGILHAAGIADYEGVIQGRTREMSEGVMAPKIRGTLVFDRLFKDEELDFFILFSSIGNIVYKVKFGQVGYNAANEFLDAFACYNNTINNRFTTAINWNDWLELGMSVEAVNRKLAKANKKENIDYKALLPDALTPAQGVEVFKRILAARLVNVAVCTQDLPIMIKRQDHLRTEELTIESQLIGKILEPSTALHRRPDIGTTYVAPGDEFEQSLAQIFSDFLGIQQVGIDDNFFDLGISSLDLVIITRKLKEVLDKEVPIVIMFTYSTVRTLARYLTQGKETADEDKETAGKGKDKKVERPEIFKPPENLLKHTINILKEI